MYGRNGGRSHFVEAAKYLYDFAKADIEYLPIYSISDNKATSEMRHLETFLAYFSLSGICD